MASNIIRHTFKLINSLSLKTLAPHRRTFSVTAANSNDESDAFTFSSEAEDRAIHLKAPNKETSSSSVSMPMSFMTGSIVGKRFYNKVTTREADDGNGWSVMLDYRTLKTPCKRPLKLPTIFLAKAIAAEWDYQQTDGIRPFTMPLMKIACTALERVPVVRPKIIDNLMCKFSQDLVFCRAPKDNDLTIGVYGTRIPLSEASSSTGVASSAGPDDSELPVPPPLPKSGEPGSIDGTDVPKIENLAIVLSVQTILSCGFWKFKTRSG